MKKFIALLFTFALALSLVTVGFASQNYVSDVVLTVGGESNPNPGGPGDSGDTGTKPGGPGDTGDQNKPGDTGTKPGGPGDSGDQNKPGDGSGKPNNPSKPSTPSKPSRPSGGGTSGSGKPSTSKPSNQNPNANKPRGDKPGGVDSNDKPYYLIQGVHVNKTFREEGYMYGFKQFVFGPDEYLTRAQFAAIMDRVFYFDDDSMTKTFDDIKNHWAEDSIRRLASNNIILGVSDVEFRPNDALTRGHVLLMLTRVLDTAEYSKIARWDSVKSYHASETVSRLLNSGIYDDMNSDYNINARITRGEMVHLMNNIIYGRDIRDTQAENFIKSHGVYLDLTGNPDYVYYNDCVKALNDPFVEREALRLS